VALPGAPSSSSIKNKNVMMSDKQLGFVFPGQGSQATGMLAELAEAHPLVGETFAEASTSLGFDLWELVQNNPNDALNKTANTQPALLAASVAVWRLWQELGGAQPTLMAGHSLGEYSALVCANVLSFADAVALVADRGKYMQEAVPEGVGAMAAILGLEDELVLEVCKEAAGSQVVSAANYNSSGQVVIAGNKEAVERATALAKEAGARRAMLLPVSVPSHCALMQEAADRFAERLEQVRFSEADIPVIQNVDVETRTVAVEIKQALLKQLHQPVRWVETIEKLNSMNVTRIIECGPGKVLAGLIKRIDRSIEVKSVFDLNSLDAAINGGQS
jgi:[acyl-carrier-protein] S-malonyltransferase